MARDRVAVKCVSGDGAGELGRSMKFLKMLADNGIKWRNSETKSPKSNGTADKEIQQLMVTARSQLANSGRGDDFWMFAIADAGFKTPAMTHKYLGGKTPCELLTGKQNPFNYDRRRIRGSDCFVNQHVQYRRAGSQFHPYVKRRVLVI